MVVIKITEKQFHAIASSIEDLMIERGKQDEFNWSVADVPELKSKYRHGKKNGQPFVQYFDCELHVETLTQDMFEAIVSDLGHELEIAIKHNEEWRNEDGTYIREYMGKPVHILNIGSIKRVHRHLIEKLARVITCN